MFGWLKPDPVKKLRKEYEAKMAEAMKTQREGDIPAYAILMREAEDLREKLEAAEAQQS